MKLGVIADSHDNLPLVREAVLYFNEEDPVDAVVHAGDYVAPFTLREFAKLKAPFNGVFGNNDGERAGINAVMPQIVQPPLRLVLGGKKIVVTHEPERLTEADRKAADIVIFGHTHNKLVEQTENKLVLNPGELGGWLTGNSTLAVIDLETLAVEIVYLREDCPCEQ